MAYSVASVEIRGNWGHLNNVLNSVESRLNSLTSSSKLVNVMLNKSIFTQIDNVKTQLASIGGQRMTLTADFQVTNAEGAVVAATRVGKASRQAADDTRAAAAAAKELAAQNKAMVALQRYGGLSEMGAHSVVDRLDADELGNYSSWRREFAAVQRQMRHAKVDAGQFKEAVKDALNGGDIKWDRWYAVKRDIDSAIVKTRQLAAEAKKTKTDPDTEYLKVIKKELDQARLATVAFNKELQKTQALPQKLAAGFERFGTQVANRFKKEQAEIDKSNQKLTAFGRTHEGLNNTVKQLINTINRWLIGYLAVSGLIKLFQGLKYAVLDYNSMLEQSRISLTTMLDGSSQAADQLLGKLEKFAARTPFQFAELVPLTQKLVAMGVVAKESVQDQAVPALQAMSDAVSALGSGTGSGGLESIIRALGQMSQKGKASAEEVTQQLAEANINGVKYLAQQMKVTQGEVFDLMKKGAIDGKQAVAAILLGLSEDKSFKGINQKMMATFGGAMSNVQDSLTALTAKGFAPLFTEISKTAQAIAKIVATKSFENWAKTQMAAVIGYMRMLGNTVSWLAKQFADKMPYITALLMAMTAVRILTGIYVLQGAIIALGNGTATAGTRASAALGVWAVALIAFVAAYRNIEQVGTVTKWVGETVLKIFKGITVGIAHAIDFITKPIQALSGLLSSIPEATLDKFGIGGDVVRGFRDFFNIANMGGLGDDVGKWFDDQIAAFGRGHAKMDKFVKGGIGGSSGYTDMMAGAKEDMKKATADGAAEMAKAQAQWRKQLEKGLMREGDDKSGKGKASKLEKDRLEDAAKLNEVLAGQTKKYYEDMAKSVEDSAKRQLDALKSIKDGVQDLLGGFQDSLAQYGILTSPLDAVITRIEKLLNIGPSAQKIGIDAINALGAIDKASVSAQKGYLDHALHARMSLDKNAGGDGSEPARQARMDALGQGGGGVGDKIAAAAVRMQSRASNFVHQCDRLADTTVRAATTMFNGIMGPRSGDTAARTMARFMNAGIGHRANGNYKAGDIAYTGNHVGGGAGHVMIVGPDGRFYDQYGANRKPKTRPDWVVSSGGSGVSSQMPSFLKGAGGKGIDNAAASAAGGDAQGIVQQVLSMLGENKLSKFAALPKSFGPAIANSEAHASRFLVQMRLIDDVFQKQFKAQYGEKIFGEYARYMGEAADTVDKELANQKLLETTKALASAETDRRKGLALMRPFVKENSVDSYEMARAQELYNQKVAFARSSDMVRMFQVDRAGFNKALGERDRQNASDYDLTKGEERTVSMAKYRMELNRATYALTQQLPLIQDTKLNEAQLSLELANQAYYLEQVYRLQDEGHTDTRARELAAELTALQSNNQESARSVALQREMNQTRKEMARTSAMAQAREEIYQTTAYGSEAQDRALRMADALAEVEKARAGGKYTTTQKLTSKALGWTDAAPYTFNIQKFDQAAYDTDREAATRPVENALRAEQAEARRSAIYSAQQELLKAQNNLSLKNWEQTAKVTDSMRAQSELQLEINQRQGTKNPLLQEELQLRNQTIDVMRNMEQLEQRLADKARQRELQESALAHSDRIGSLQDQIDSLGIPDDSRGLKRGAFLHQREMERAQARIDEMQRRQMSEGGYQGEDRWNEMQKAIDDATTAKQRMDEEWNKQVQVDAAQRSADAIRQAYDTMGSAIQGTFDAMWQTSGSVFDRISAGAGAMADSISNSLLKMAEQIAINQILSSIFGSDFQRLLGGYGASAGGGATIPGIAGPTSIPANMMANMASRPATVNQTYTFPNVTDANSARGVSDVIAQKTASATDSRRTSAQTASAVVDYGTKNRY